MRRIEDLEGFVDFPSGFQLLSEKPIDARYVGDSVEFLQSIIDIGAAYPGLRVFIKSENRSYIYKETSNGSYSFEVENLSLTDSQLKAIDSGITKEKVKEIDGKYSIPSTGIPERDLSEAVKNKLSKAEKSIQEENDPTVPAWAKQSEKPEYSVEEIKGLPRALDDKVSKIDGKGLSDENYTLLDKIKLEEIETGAEVNTIESISVNGVTLTPSDKKLEIPLKTFNGNGVLGKGDIKVIEADKDQNIGGYKSFSRTPSIPDKTDLDLKNPSSTQPATEAQVASAVGGLGEVLTRDSYLDASKLIGEIPGSVKFPVLNQNTSGKAGSADKLSTSHKISVGGKVTSEGVDFDGTSDIVIEVDSLSQDPNDYPTLNQDTTGNSASADKLSKGVKLKVNLSRTEEVSFDGSKDLEDIPVVGRIGADNLLQGKGDGSSRTVLASGRSTTESNLELVNLEPQDVGLGNVTNDKQATKEEFDELVLEVRKLEKLGSFVGSYSTIEDLPGNISSISERYGKTATVNDFVTVRGGSYEGRPDIPENSATCWSILGIDEEGTITWAYEYTYDFDLTGKIDKIIGESLEGSLPEITGDGYLKNSGYKVSSLLRADEKISGSEVTYKEKIEKSLTEGDTASGAKKLIHLGTNDPCSHGSEQTPVYFEDGTPWPASKVPSFNSKNKLIRLGYTEDLENPGKFKPTSEEIDDVRVKYSDESDFSKKAKRLEDANVGNLQKPVFINSEGVPQVIDWTLGVLSAKDLLFEGENDDPGYTERTEGSIRVTYNPEGKSLVEKLKFEFEPVEISKEGETYYGIILPQDISDDGSEGLKTVEGRNERGELKKTIEGYLGIASGALADDLEFIDNSYYLIPYNFRSVGSGHRISGIPRVRVFELSFKIPTEDNENLEIKELEFSENYGMATLEPVQEEIEGISKKAMNIKLTPNCKATYYRLTSEAQGVYLVEISK